MHQRQKIREKVAALLVAANTSCGAKVYTDRAKKIPQSQLPAIFIFTEAETSSLHLEPFQAYTRKLNLVVWAMVYRATELDDEMDTLADQIETALRPAWRTDGYWNFLELTATNIDVSDEGDQRIGSIRLTYTVDYDWPQGFG